MKRGRIFKKSLLGILVFAILIRFLTTVIAEPIVRKHILALLNKTGKDYAVEIEKLHISLIKPGIEFEDISIYYNQGSGIEGNLSGQIASVKFNGIHVLKAVIKKDYVINAVIISNSLLKGQFAFKNETVQQVVSGSNVRIKKLNIDNVNLRIADVLTSKLFSVKEAALKIYNLQVAKNDTLSPAIIDMMDFSAAEFTSITADSNYSIKAGGISYTANSKQLSIDSLHLLPNYSDYIFTDRSKFETDRFDAQVNNVYANDFSAIDFISSGNLECAFIEIGEMNLSAFRDKRKEFLHTPRATFQEDIYNYPGKLHIDSIEVKSGNINYIEHAEQALQAGYINFKKIRARIYNISNDTLFKEKSDSLSLNGNALLMGSGRLNLQLTAPLFDPQNTFSLKGSLTGMKVEELNPILENNAFIFATGYIESMIFKFTADNTKSSGTLTVLYHDLDLTLKNKATDDTTAFKERLTTIIANMKIKDSNPLPADAVRKGTIDYQRDPEKYLFNYSFKSILSGIKSTIANNRKSR